MVLTDGVSSRIAATVASCQSRSKGEASGIACVTLLAPGVPMDVVAHRLPKAGLIRFDKFESSHPFSAFPKIQMRYQQSGRPAVSNGDRQIVIVGGNHCFA